MKYVPVTRLLSPTLFCGVVLVPLMALSGLAACSSGEPTNAETLREGSRGGDARGGRPGGASRPGGGGFGGFPGFGDTQTATAIPVEVTAVQRRAIADYLETNGTLEAENEVDIVARTSGPIVELLVEEGMSVRQGQLLARIDADEVRAQLEISRVNLEEARLAFERAKTSHKNEIISQEAFDQAKSRFDSAQAQIYGLELQLSYTEIKAPFDGQIVERYVKFAEYIGNNQSLFRISDFDPLLCPIKIPEKDLEKLTRGQPARLRVETYPDRDFEAEVLRIKPVVDGATGTVEVTLSVDGEQALRPGMFASVFLEIAVHEDALVIPKDALVLESIGDTVYVKEGDVASRREIEIGFEETDSVEVLGGLEEGEEVVVVGQDGLSDGTPIYVLSRTRFSGGLPSDSSDVPQAGPGGVGGRVGDGASDGSGARPAARSRGGSFGPGGFDPGSMTEEQLAHIRQRMKERGMSDGQIEARLEQMRSGQFPGRGGPGAGGGRPGS